MPDSSFPRFAPRVCCTSLPSSSRQAGSFPSGGGRREPRAHKPPERRHQAAAGASAGPALLRPRERPRNRAEAGPLLLPQPCPQRPELLQPDKPTASPHYSAGRSPRELGEALQVKTPAGGTRQPPPRLSPVAPDTHKQRAPSPRQAGTSPHLRPRLRPASTPGTLRR